MIADGRAIRFKRCHHGTTNIMGLGVCALWGGHGGRTCSACTCSGSGMGLLRPPP